MLHEVARRLRENQESLARTMTIEGGKPLVENRDEIDWCAAAFDYYAEIGRDSAGRVIPPIESSQVAMVVKDPLGVVGCIVPWNYPLLLLTWKVAPALAAGCTVVAKPSEVTPLSTLELAACVDHLPAGVVNLIAGAGDVGAAMSADERIDCIAFTGSVATGRRVALACAERLARVNLEMGGKDPFIVCADMADSDVGIEIAARGGAWAAYLNAGQVCTSAERFYVMEDVYDDYVSAFVAHTETLVLGDPLEVATDIGPMVSAPQRQKVVDQLEAAVAAGAEVLTGGDSGGQDRGHFLSPAVVAGAARRDRPAARGDVRPGRPDRPRQGPRRGDRPRQRHPLRPRRQRLHPRPQERRPLHEGAPRRHRLDQRPAHRQRRRPLRRLQAVRASAANSAARASRPSRRRSTSTWRRRSSARSGGTPTRSTAPSRGLDNSEGMLRLRRPLPSACAVLPLGKGVRWLVGWHDSRVGRDADRACSESARSAVWSALSVPR